MKKIVIVIIVIIAITAGYFIFNKGEITTPTEEILESEEGNKEGQGEEAVVKVFFSNSELNKEALCEKVFPVERTVKEVKENIPAITLRELLKGPTEQEEEEGYFTNINQGVQLKSLQIEEGRAVADFSQQLEFQLGGSCRVMAIQAEIEETLKQFPEVEEVVISIEGRTEGILQP